MVYLFLRDLESWLTGIKALVSSDELAKDVAGAEALLERHQVSVARYSGADAYILL
jgi:spectrin alpha